VEQQIACYESSTEFPATLTNSLSTEPTSELRRILLRS